MKGDNTMTKKARYNKHGDKFEHCVTIAPQPGQPDPTYSYKFPTLEGNQVVEKWAKKVRPIQDLTRYLQGCGLKRFRDYLIDFNGQDYEYWFRDSRVALLFSLRCSFMKQTRQHAGSHRFKIECPDCHKHIDQEDIEWRI